MHDSELADVWSAGHSAFVIRQLSVAMVRGPLTGGSFYGMAWAMRAHRGKSGRSIRVFTGGQVVGSWAASRAVYAVGRRAATRAIGDSPAYRTTSRVR